MKIGKHLIGIRGLSKADITHILDTAEKMKEISDRPIKKVPALRGKLIVNLFFENSTRTRSSFEIAEKRLSADSLNFSASTSAVQKGETLLEPSSTSRGCSPTLRHAARVPGPASSFELREGILQSTRATAAHEHPTQALLDAMTLREKKGGFEALTSDCGDITHSRSSGRTSTS